MTTERDDYRRGAVVQHPLQVDLTADVIEPELDEFRPLLGQVLVLGNDVSMTAPADADADHGERKSQKDE